MTLATYRHVPRGTRLIQVTLENNDKNLVAEAQTVTTVEGRVVSHHEKTIGRWLWKEVFFLIRVELSEEQVDNFLNPCRHATGQKLLSKENYWIDLGIPPIDLSRFPVGSNLEIKLGFNTEAVRYYRGQRTQFVISVYNMDTDDMLIAPSVPHHI